MRKPHIPRKIIYKGTLDENAYLNNTLMINNTFHPDSNKFEHIPSPSKRINIEIIPYEEQRYPTVGDWWRDSNGNIQIRVNNLNDIRQEISIAIHELIEMLLCEQRGISEESVSKFDKSFEKKRKKGNTNEPGDDPNAPYKKEHFFATNIERQIINEFGIDWTEYDNNVNKSCQTYKKNKK